MKIEFFWNGSIVGHFYSLSIDDKEIDLNLSITERMNKDLVTSKIKEKLLTYYNIDYSDKEINFKWGGRL